MGIIHRLSSEIIAHISAGQVVDRPASVVKELIDNALDAQATSIQVELVSGGLEKIQVTDNGVGMIQADLEESIRPYTTSKIKTQDDLLHIETFGFRGEALASIAQVADVSIDSKVPDAVSGWHIRVERGEIVDSQPIGMPDGTRVDVERLFYAVPARRKFVKAVSTEIRACIHIIASYALAHPHVNFELIHNKKSLIHVTQHHGLLDRVSSLVDQRSARTARVLDYAHGTIRIKGYMGHPSASRGSDAYMFIHVNGRPIHNPELKKTIRKAYGTLLPQRSFPVCVLSISYPYESIDVNVDPQKSRIRLHGEDILKSALSDALKEHFSQLEGVKYADVSGRTMDTGLASNIKDTFTPWTFNTFQSARFVQIRNLYIVVEHDKGINIYDQHAVHERILYEEYVNDFKHKRTHAKSLELHSPVKIVLTAEQKVLFEEFRPLLEVQGFMFDTTREVAVTHVPEHFQNSDSAEIITSILDTYSSHDDHDDALLIDPRTHRTLTYLACRSAIQAGDPLSEEDMKQLITKLMTCEQPQTCPHGRPTCVHISASELDTLFQR